MTTSASDARTEAWSIQAVASPETTRPAQMAKIFVAQRWRDARARHRAELVQDEGEETFAGLQRFLAIVKTLADQRRLCRHLFLARKPAGATRHEGPLVS